MSKSECHQCYNKIIFNKIFCEEGIIIIKIITGYPNDVAL